jgi:hypothetical protein
VVDEPESTPDELRRRFDAFHTAVAHLPGRLGASQPSSGAPTSDVGFAGDAVEASLELRAAMTQRPPSET